MTMLAFRFPVFYNQHHPGICIQGHNGAKDTDYICNYDAFAPELYGVSKAPNPILNWILHYYIAIYSRLQTLVINRNKKSPGWGIFTFE